MFLSFVLIFWKWKWFFLNRCIWRIVELGIDLGFIMGVLVECVFVIVVWVLEWIFIMWGVSVCVFIFLRI